MVVERAVHGRRQPDDATTAPRARPAAMTGSRRRCAGRRARRCPRCRSVRADHRQQQRARRADQRLPRARDRVQHRPIAAQVGVDGALQVARAHASCLNAKWMTPSAAAAAGAAGRGRPGARAAPRRPRRCNTSADASERARPMTSCPAVRSSGTTAEPICPLAPVTNTRMMKPPWFAMLRLGDWADVSHCHQRSTLMSVSVIRAHPVCGHGTMGAGRARPAGTGGDRALRRAGLRASTVAEIAERAGLTERTFFRHFADKREVLFGGSDGLRSTSSPAWPDAPASAAPIAPSPRRCTQRPPCSRRTGRRPAAVGHHRRPPRPPRAGADQAGDVRGRGRRRAAPPGRQRPGRLPDGRGGPGRLQDRLRGLDRRPRRPRPRPAHHRVARRAQGGRRRQVARRGFPAVIRRPGDSG